MNPMQAISPDEQNVVEFCESPGRRLRVVRQSRGIEIERIAQQLHLRVATVEALEQDRYDDMAGPVFVAGYLTNYARLLGIDSEPLIAAYRSANPDPEPTELSIKAPPHQEIGSGHILVRLVSIAMVAAVIALIVLWWQGRAEMLGAQSPDESASPTLATISNQTALDRVAATAATAPTATGVALPVPAAAGASLKTTVDQTDDLSLTPALPTAVPQATSPGATPQAGALTPSALETAPRATEITLTVTGPTSVKVQDSTGTVILNRKLRKGDTRVLAGTPPYSFAIGNAAAVQMTVGGRPIDLAEYTQGNAARFTFDPRNPE